jgi:hypothetical protein
MDVRQETAPTPPVELEAIAKASLEELEGAASV